MERRSRKEGGSCSRQNRSRLVLIADDDAEVRTLLGQLLGARGFLVDLAADGVELLRKYSEWLRRGRTPDLLITDVEMPNCDGLTTLEKIREIVPGQAAIVVTGEPSPAVQSRARRLGVKAVLRKPLSFKRLLSEVLRLPLVAAPSS